jgi:hypothetical protein
MPPGTMNGAVGRLIAAAAFLPHWNNIVFAAPPSTAAPIFILTPLTAISTAVAHFELQHELALIMPRDDFRSHSSRSLCGGVTAGRLAVCCLPWWYQEARVEPMLPFKRFARTVRR